MARQFAQRRLGRSFTLIELLVVIAIVAILASMLLPALSSARETARSSSCQNNLKQCSLADINYADESDNYYPVGFRDNQRSWYQQTFMQVFPKIDINNGTQRKPYQKANSSLITCPSDPNPSVYDIAWSYSANQVVCPFQKAADLTWFQAKPRQISGFNRPEQDFVVYDGYSKSGADAGIGANINYLASRHPTWTASRSNAAVLGYLLVHNGKFNVMFLDAHVWQSPGWPEMEALIIEGKPDIYWGEN